MPSGLGTRASQAFLQGQGWQRQQMLGTFCKWLVIQSPAQPPGSEHAVSHGSTGAAPSHPARVGGQTRACSARFSLPLSHSFSPSLLSFFVSSHLSFSHRAIFVDWFLTVSMVRTVVHLLSQSMHGALGSLPQWLPRVVCFIPSALPRPLPRRTALSRLGVSLAPDLEMPPSLAGDN